MSLTDEKFECFKIDIQDKIAHIILNRPEKMNSLQISFWSDLPIDQPTKKANGGFCNKLGWLKSGT